MKRYWTYAIEADVVALMSALIRAGVARFDVADNRGGNGCWIVVVNVYDKVGPKFSALPPVEGGWKGGKQ